MTTGAKVSIGVNFLTINIFRNVDPARREDVISMDVWNRVNPNSQK